MILIPEKYITAILLVEISVDIKILLTFINNFLLLPFITFFAFTYIKLIKNGWLAGYFLPNSELVLVLLNYN